MTILEKLIEKYPNRGWNWYWIYRNPNVSLSFIENFSKNCDRIQGYCYHNPNIIRDIPDVYRDYNIIINNPNINWNWQDISVNPNLTLEFIENNLDKIYFEYLSENLFSYDPFFQSSVYRKRTANERCSIFKEELIKVACHPRRILNWDETTQEQDHPLYGLKQEDIDKMI